jgi:hypothetical protein
MLKVFVKHLPDMQIAMNRLDQPRVIVEWEQLQKHLKAEEESRTIPPEVINEFSKNSELGMLGRSWLLPCLRLLANTAQATRNCLPQSGSEHPESHTWTLQARLAHLNPMPVTVPP